jgi:transketolase
MDALNEESRGKPKAIIGETIKGKGVSFMEDQVGWHGKAPNEEELKLALQELGGNME